MKPVFLLLALTACTEYDLGKDDDPVPTDDTGEPVDVETGHPDTAPPEETGDTSEPPVDETGLPPDAATEPIYAHTATTLYSVGATAPYTRVRIGDFEKAGRPVDDITDIAIDTNGLMYAVSFSTLYRVDATNASLTQVALSGQSDLNALTFLSDGTLLAGGGSSLYVVDPLGGSFTRAASIGSWYFAGDMVGLPDGLLYCAMSRSSTGGSTTLVVWDMGAARTVRSGATGTGSLYGMAFAEDTLFGFDADGGIYSLDQTTGTGSRVATTGEVWWGATTNPVVW